MPMPVRTPFHPMQYARHLRDTAQEGVPADAFPQRKTVSLHVASQHISDHLMERAKQDETLYQDIMQAGLGEPHAQQRIKIMIASLVHEFQWVIDPHTLYDHGCATESLFAMVCGAGLIEDVKQLPDVEEVQVIGRHIYVIRHGETVLHTRMFSSLDEVRMIQDRLALCGKKPISERQPVVQSYLWNRSRLVMTREPYSDVPSIHIRNFIVQDVSLQKLVELGTINARMAEILHLCVRYHASILVGGGTNTGKTTLLFALAQEIPEGERIRTLETEFEIALRERLRGNRNILAVRACEQAQIPMEEAFKPLLVMSPEWIVVGEAKGAEIAQMVQGALRGHDVMGTMHTKYRESLLTDIVDMLKMDGRTHEEATARRRVARAFNLIVFLRRVQCRGQMRRIVTEITEMYVNEDDQPVLQPLVEWDYDAQEWVFTTGTFSNPFKNHMASRGANAATFAHTGVWS